MRSDTAAQSHIYLSALSERGATPEGVLWPNADDLAKRYEVLLGPLALEKPGTGPRIRLLDLGCGPGFLLDYLSENGLLDRIDYTGVDVNQKMIDHARNRWRDQRFEVRDLRDDPFDIDAFDYCIVCGVFTARFGNSHDDTVAMLSETMKAVWPSVTRGMGFNVMSKHVDWEREDLFHWPLDDMMAFCKRHLSRHVTLRLDYGLWEASALVMKKPADMHGITPGCWKSGPEVAK